MSEYNNESKNEKLQHWLMLHQPSDNMIYKQAWWNHHVFIRDTIIPMFYWEDANRKHKDNWEEKNTWMSEQYDIVGTHTSKSVLLPVIKMRYKGVEIVFRYNFYDFEVTVVSEYDIKLPQGLFASKKGTRFYYQGFPKEYQIHTTYEESKQKFSVSIQDPQSYNFYTFMFLIKNKIDGIVNKLRLVS